MQINEFPKDHLISQLCQTLSIERLGTYLVASGHDPDRALQLYMWNACIGEAFHVPIQAVEVGLRNRINQGLKNQFGDHWWREAAFLAVADNDRLADLDQVKTRIRNRGLELSTPQIVAGLSFGFWVGLLLPRYNPPLWSAQLRSAFPNFPTSRGRKSLTQAAQRVAYLRNRIWHHEPIFKEDLSRDFSITMTLLEWICPATAGWIRPKCRVPELLRQKP